MSLLFLNMKFEVALIDQSTDDSQDPVYLQDLKEKCDSLQNALHGRDTGVSNIHDEVKQAFYRDVQPKIDSIDNGANNVPPHPCLII